ncbi:MAG: endolytic transglycosylase MltG [Acidobacteria bacterium]|nr:endolytic transglycosylase MltG [Acidobacteriota bacterium]
MKFLGFLFLLAVLAVAAIGFFLYVPFGPSTETFVDIPSGTPSRAMSAQLEKARIIRSRYAFQLLRAVKGTRLKAGEYRFDHPATAIEVYDRIARGDVYTRAVIIPEGFNLFDIAAAVEAAGLAPHTVMLDAARTNTALIQQWNPNATSLEGYLFPDTYRFSRHTTPQQMLAVMVKRFGKAMNQLGIKPGTTDVPRLVTMASLVEKEVREDSERPLVAGVFENRLRVGMPLATDPTVIYAAMLEGRWKGTIYASDLANDSAYNTYKHSGLPPGPICSPGMAALRAALHPAVTDKLYFVADAAGHTRFSATLKEHDEQVKAYRKAVK